MKQFSKNIVIWLIAIAGLISSEYILPKFPKFIHAAEQNKRELIESNKVRAKIGVQISGDRIIRAKSKEVLKVGDAVRLYVHSEASCYVYIVHTDGKNVNLLNITEQKIQSSTLILPSAQDFYEIDGQSGMEKFTIICTPQPIEELADMEKRTLTSSEWSDLESELQNESVILDSEDEESPFTINGGSASIAGNVRKVGNTINNIKNSSGANDDPFLKELQIFSGKNLVIKSYQFKIQK